MRKRLFRSMQFGCCRESLNAHVHVSLFGGVSLYYTYHDAWVDQALAGNYFPPSGIMQSNILRHHKLQQIEQLNSLCFG